MENIQKTCQFDIFHLPASIIVYNTANRFGVWYGKEKDFI
jgi:hypothetical protein